MRIPEPLNFNRTQKTASLAENKSGSARKILAAVATDLVKTDGTVKSGYLKLKMRDGEAHLQSNHIGGGATAATDLVKNLVQDAYGENARQALDLYLQGKGKDKIGTLSFVKLIQRMEADADTVKGQAPRLAQAKGLDPGALIVAGLNSRPEQEQSAAAAGRLQMASAQRLLDASSIASDPRHALPGATAELNSLREAMSTIRALQLVPPEDSSTVELKLLELTQELETEGKKLDLSESADRVAQGPDIQSLKARLREATTEIEGLFAKHQELGEVGVKSTSSKDLKGVVDSAKPLRDQIQSLTKQAQALSGQIRQAATGALVLENASWCETDADGNLQIKLDLPPNKKLEIAETFKATLDQVVRGGSASGKAAHPGLAHFEAQMGAMQRRLEDRAEKLAQSAGGKALGEQILSEMKPLYAALETALTKRNGVEKRIWGARDIGDLYTLEQALSSGSPSLEAKDSPAQLADLLDADAQVQQARQKALDHIGLLRGTVEADAEGLLSTGAQRVLQRTLDGWDQKCRIANTDIGWEESSPTTVKHFAKPAAPASVQGLGPAWALARQGALMGVVNPTSGTILLPREDARGNGENVLSLDREPAQDWNNVSPQESLTYLSRLGDRQRAVVLSAGLEAKDSYAAAGGRREDISAYSDRFQNLIKSREAFPNAPWQPNLLGYCGDEQGLKLIFEEVAPTHASGMRLENTLISPALYESTVMPPPKEEVRNVMSTYIADMAACMAELHEQGWRMTQDVAYKHNCFGVSPEGKLKLLRTIAPGTSTNIENNVKSLARALIGNMGVLGPDSAEYLRNFKEEAGRGRVGFMYEPDTDERAFEIKVDSILTRAYLDEAAEDGVQMLAAAEDGMQIFETDPSARKRVYSSLGLQAYGDWIERALSPQSTSSPATALELANLIKANEPGAGSATARSGLYLAAQRVFDQQYRTKVRN
jgi:hypothetical protein